MTKLRNIITILFIAFACLSAAFVRAQEADDTASRLLQRVRITFNQNNEQEFYEAVEEYGNYLLKQGDISGFYLNWKNEVLYDVNHNHFYRAMRKTMAMQSDMEKRGATGEYYKTTHLQGIIYSLRGNISLARQYFEKALEQVDHAQPANLISLYMDLSNIEMDTQPQEALNHLDRAIDVIKANYSGYEYSDAIGFKVIVAFAMRDWGLVNKTFNEYMTLRKTLGEDFSTTYYNYAVICKSAADKRFDDAIKQTYELTNTTDIFKFQTEIYELAGDTVRAFESQKRYMAIKDSVNNVIMSEEMVGSATDLQHAEEQSEAANKLKRVYQWTLHIVIAVALLIGFLIYRMNRLRYMRRLQKQNRELLIARDKCHESERMKVNFLQNMSHEIRTPLNIISGYAQIISDPQTLMSDMERADMAQRITHSTHTIVRIVDELLDISGKESIHYIDKTDMVGCNDLVRQILAPYMEKASAVEIVFDPQLKECCSILMNRIEVEKILHHLLDNALKFTQQGTITFSTHYDKQDHMVCFSVTDTGCGIKEGDEEKIFEHFYKSDIYKEGIGLGLSLGRRVARQLGGDVILDTSYKEGSRFILKLPKE